MMVRIEWGRERLAVTSRRKMLEFSDPFDVATRKLFPPMALLNPVASA